MIFTIKSPEEKDRYLSYIRQIAMTEPLCMTKYLDFGTRVVRVLCHSPKLLLFLEQQLPFVLRDEVAHYDETIVFWQATDIQKIARGLGIQFNPEKNLRLRVEMLATGRRYPDILLMDPDFSTTTPVMRLSVSSGMIEVYDTLTHTCYYAAADLSPEELIKQGHLFVQQLNVLLKTETVNLTHGAVFGYNGQGVLLCARGQRGKSTLTVHSLLNGCEYVSDDYQILEKKEGQLYAYPLYSIITLSPEMYGRMYSGFKGKFCSNNARKDKYVFNISSYEAQFKTRYPVSLCLFPEIVPDKDPSITPCSNEEKGRAIVQFIHSTVLQMRDLNNQSTIKKLFHMVCDLPFYRFNLSPQIAQNTEYLRGFLSQKRVLPTEAKLPRYLLDITFDVANILDTETYTFYSLNKFATNVYEMLLSGVEPELIAQKLTGWAQKRPALTAEFNLFIQMLQKYGLLSVSTIAYSKPVDLSVDFMAECGYKLSLQVFGAEQTQELIYITKGK